MCIKFTNQYTCFRQFVFAFDGTHPFSIVLTQFRWIAFIFDSSHLFSLVQVRYSSYALIPTWNLFELDIFLCRFHTIIHVFMSDRFNIRLYSFVHVHTLFDAHMFVFHLVRVHFSLVQFCQHSFWFICASLLLLAHDCHSLAFVCTHSWLSVFSRWYVFIFVRFHSLSFVLIYTLICYHQ